MRNLQILTLGLALLVSVASCCSCRGTKSKSMAALEGTQWQMIQMNGGVYSAKEDSYTLNFSHDGRVSGKGDCNRLSGSFETTAEGGLLMKGLVSTRAFCPDQTTEDLFMRTVDGVDSYVIDGDTLMLMQDGELKMIFKAMPVVK